FELELVCLPLFPSWQTAAELTLAQLKEVGVNGRLRLVDLTGWNTVSTAQGDYQGWHGPLTTQSSATADLRIRFTPQGSRNPGKVNDPKLVDLIEKQATLARDPAARKNALMDIQRYLLDQGYAIPIWGSAQVTGQWPWVKNWRPYGQPQ